MRLIDADALIQDLREHKIPFNADINEAIIVAPTVDAVEVVRCKDCKCYDNKTMECCGRSGVFYADDYCSRGRER